MGWHHAIFYPFWYPPKRMILVHNFKNEIEAGLDVWGWPWSALKQYCFLFQFEFCRLLTWRWILFSISIWILLLFDLEICCFFLFENCTGGPDINFHFNMGLHPGTGGIRHFKGHIFCNKLFQGQTIWHYDNDIYKDSHELWNQSWLSLKICQKQWVLEIVQ